MPKRHGDGHHDDDSLAGHRATSEDAPLRFQRQQKRSSSAAGIIRKTLQAHSGGCVGWFLEHDHDETGLFPAGQMVRDLQRCCPLTAQDAREFVEALDKFESRLIPLSSLWVALNCEGLGRGRHADSDWEAFEREILSLSRHAVGVLNDSLDRQNRLQESIRLEAIRMQDSELDSLLALL